MTRNKEYLLVEPIAKTPYPPLGLMKISSMLKKRHKNAVVLYQIGNEVPERLLNPAEIYITSLFTWDIDKTINSIQYYQQRFPKSEIHVGGIAASLLHDYIYKKTGIKPHVGLLSEAESYSPDYSASFGRKINYSISFTSRGCIRSCNFCHVKTLEPDFFVKHEWEKDINNSFPAITFWDNNWLASPNFDLDCEKLEKLNKRVDFNQGLDARLFDEDKARRLSKINLNPIRFAFDDIRYEKYILRAISLAKKYFKSEISVYVLYNFKDTPEDFFYRIDLLNRAKVLSFPMEYREVDESGKKFPGKHWDAYLLRGLKLSLLFYYRKGMITEKRGSFESIYGKTAKEFKDKLYTIYDYDKNLKRKKVADHE